MRFGIVLLLLIAICSLIGSIVPQGNDKAFYMANFVKSHQLILLLKFDNIFSSFYFVSLIALLCVNLMFCSVIRFRGLIKSTKNYTTSIGKNSGGTIISDVEKNILVGFFEKKHFRTLTLEENNILFYSHKIGHYGSFITHIGILMLLLFSTLVLYNTSYIDYGILPGSSIALADGSTVNVNDFVLYDETGRADFISTINISTAEGEQSGAVKLIVNRPFSFAGQKYYQQSYNLAGTLEIVNTISNNSDKLILKEPCFFNTGDNNGIMFIGINDNANDNSQSLSYGYVLIEGAQKSAGSVVPGETIRSGDMDFHFNVPISYPVIRIKKAMNFLMTGLYISFVFLLAGLWLCFFYTPISIYVTNDFYLIRGKNKDLLINEIKDEFRRKRK
jgi:cytochrome c biogenesis protein